MSTSAVATGLIEADETLDWTEYPMGVPVLVVDDDVEVRTMIGRCLRKFNVEVVGTGSLRQARRKLKTKEFSFVFLDKCLPDGDGVQFLGEIRKIRPNLSCAIITGAGSGAEAHSTLEDGVFDYLPKPILISKIRSVLTTRYPGLLGSGDKRSVVVGPVVDGTDGVGDDDSKVKFIAHSPSMISISIAVTRIGKIGTLPPVLISGPTGSGKEVVARLIHERSSRADEKFKALNCGALPTELIDSCLFGHRRGAFTGADTDRTGYFEEADGGTIFLDEITETTPALQVKLLRVLQEGCITRVGSTEEIKVDVRVIAATNRNLKTDSSSLREDLYYRLAGCEIFLPPLRERTEDIIPLAFHFALRAARKVKKKVWFSVGVIEALRAYSWPGNVRELSRVIDATAGRAVDAAENIILMSDLPDCIRIEVGELRSNEIPLVGISKEFKTLAELEEEHILKVLRACGGNMAHAAKILGREVTQFRKTCGTKGWTSTINDLMEANEL